MSSLPFIDIFGYWLGIFLTFCILSFLYKDNPFYKFAEHLFIGVSIGYVIIQQYYNVLRPKLLSRIAESEHWYLNWHLIPLILVALMFVKAVSTRWSWMGRYPLAFVVALYAGLQINGVAQADLGQQIKRGMVTLDYSQINVNTASEKELTTLPGVTPSIARRIVERRKTTPFKSINEIPRMSGMSKAEKLVISEARGPVQGLDARASVSDGKKYWFGILSRLLLLLGLLASLVYFYFSVEHKGVIGKVSRFGIWILMIGFGASFGYTVQGRIALAIGRVQNIKGDTLEPAVAAQVHGPWVALVSVAIIVVGLVAWELFRKSKGLPPQGPPPSGPDNLGGIPSTDSATGID